MGVPEQFLLPSIHCDGSLTHTPSETSRFAQRQGMKKKKQEHTPKNQIHAWGVLSPLRCVCVSAPNTTPFPNQWYQEATGSTTMFTMVGSSFSLKLQFISGKNWEMRVICDIVEGMTKTSFDFCTKCSNHDDKSEHQKLDCFHQHLLFAGKLTKLTGALQCAFQQCETFWLLLWHALHQPKRSVTFPPSTLTRALVAHLQSSANNFELGWITDVSCQPSHDPLSVVSNVLQTEHKCVNMRIKSDQSMGVFHNFLPHPLSTPVCFALSSSKNTPHVCDIRLPSDKFISHTLLRFDCDMGSQVMGFHICCQQCQIWFLDSQMLGIKNTESKFF